MRIMELGLAGLLMKDNHQKSSCMIFLGKSIASLQITIGLKILTSRL
jgi:hypothetical protein